MFCKISQTRQLFVLHIYMPFFPSRILNRHQKMRTMRKHCSSTCKANSLWLPVLRFTDFKIIFTITLNGPVSDLSRTPYVHLDRCWLVAKGDLLLWCPHTETCCPLRSEATSLKSLLKTFLGRKFSWIFSMFLSLIISL